MCPNFKHVLKTCSVKKLTPNLSAVFIRDVILIQYMFLSCEKDFAKVAELLCLKVNT